MPYDVITLSREYGAGASELASLLGARLSWTVFDAEIPRVVAQRLHVSEASLEQWDEHAPGFLEEIGNSFLHGSPDLLFDASFVGRPQAPTVASATRDVVREAAGSPPVIIVGHGAQVILADRPDTLHLRLVAPIADRVRRIMLRRSLSQEDACAMAQHVDRDRMHYVQQFLGRDVRDSQLYALQVNTGIVPMPEVVAMVERLVGAGRD